MTTVQQRNFARVEVSVAAEVTFSKTETVAARTQDLSVGGVRLVLGRAVNEGQQLAVSLLLVEDGIEDAELEPVGVKAMAVWSAEGEGGEWTVGCKFKALGPAEETRLAAFLARLKSFPAAEE